MMENDWEPIASAPRDGTVIDVWRRRYELKSPTSRTIVEIGERACHAWWEKHGGPFHDGEWRARAPGGEANIILEYDKKWEVVAWIPAPPPYKKAKSDD